MTIYIKRLGDTFTPRGEINEANVAPLNILSQNETLPCFSKTAGGLVSFCEPPEGVFTSIAGCCPRCSLLMWTFTISRDFNNCRFLSLHLWGKHDAAGNLQWIILMITEQLRVLLRDSFFSCVSSSSLVSDDFHVRLNIEAPSSAIASSRAFYLFKARMVLNNGTILLQLFGFVSGFSFLYQTAPARQPSPKRDLGSLIFCSFAFQQSLFMLDEVWAS